MKTNKSYAKRLRVTRRGKVIARRPGQNHFNAKESARVKGAKRRPASLEMSQALRARFLAGGGK